MKAMMLKILVAGLVVLFVGFGCGAGDDDENSSTNSETPATSNQSGTPNSSANYRYNSPYTCPDDDLYLDSKVRQGDYVREGADEDEIFYVRVVSDSVIEVVYPEDENGDIRVETYGVVSRTLD